MATIRKKGDFQWHVQIRRKGYPVQTNTLNTKTDAEKWARDVESQMDHGIFADRAEAERTTLGEALERYRNEFTVHKKSAYSEGKKIEAWQRHSLALRPLTTIQAIDLAKYRDDRLKARKSASTVRLELSVVSHLFTVAVKEWGMPLQNPVRNIRLPRARNARERRLNTDELQYLLESLQNSGHGIGFQRNVWTRPIFEFAIETAMRRGEVLSLEWKNVDLERRIAILPETKNGERRVVPLSTMAIKILKEIPRSINGRVFSTTVNAFRLSFRRALARARRNYARNCLAAGLMRDPAFLSDFKFHDSRHEATSRLFEKGLNPIEASSVTGHKTLSMLKRYTHLNAELLAKKLG